MGDNGVLVRLSRDDLAWLRATGEPEGAAAGPERAAAWLAADNPDVFELEQAVAGVAHLLGDVGPVGFLADASWGEPVARDLGRGRYKVLAPEHVAAVAHAIESLSVRVVRQRLEGEALAALPPFGGRRLDDEDKEWLLAVLQGLMTFVRRAADDGIAVLVAAL